MTIEILSRILGWTTVVNMSILTLWFLLFMFCHDAVYRLHSKWFELSTVCFDSIHYAGIAFYKIGIFLFNLAPFLAIQIVN